MIKLSDSNLWKERGFIAGQWVDADSGQTTEIRNPANGELLGKVPHMGAAEARRAIDAAHAALPAWSK
jgi:succinate-semialdehyde dehydrogenase/glutarate-semialdehyde dehydrogenase